MAVGLILSGCSTSAPPEKESRQVASEESPAQQPEEFDEVEWMMDVVERAYPGYPMIVSVDSLDYRIAEKYREKGFTEAVALVPAVYMPYFSAQPDLSQYVLRPSDVTGNCQMIYWLEDALEVIGGYVGGYSCGSDYGYGSDEPTWE